MYFLPTVQLALSQTITLTFASNSALQTNPLLVTQHQRNAFKYVLRALLLTPLPDYARVLAMQVQHFTKTLPLKSV